MGFLGFKDGCDGMQPNRVKFEQEKIEGMTKLKGTVDDALWFGHCSTKMEGTSDEGGFEQMGLRKQQKGRKRNRALTVMWRGRVQQSDRRG